MPKSPLLILDDDPIALAPRIAGSAGFAAVVAPDKAALMRHLASRHPWGAVLVAPHLAGGGLVDFVRIVRRFSAAPVVFLADLPLPDGPDLHCLSAPYTTRELSVLLRALID